MVYLGNPPGMLLQKLQKVFLKIINILDSKFQTAKPASPQYDDGSGDTTRLRESPEGRQSTEQEPRFGRH